MFSVKNYGKLNPTTALVIPACQRLRQHSAYVPASLAMAGRSTEGRNL